MKVTQDENGWTVYHMAEVVCCEAAMHIAHFGMPSAVFGECRCKTPFHYSEDEAAAAQPENTSPMDDPA